MIHVVSTGFRAPTKQRCLDSVASQQGVAFRHWYVEAGEQHPPKDVITNLRSVIAPLPPEAVIAWIDGDDWLAHDRVLERVAAMHAAGAWVTWGSFQTSDGAPGFAAPYLPHEDVRQAPWRATHLKTLRAGLLQRIQEIAWPAGAPVAWDHLVMLAALEMAGPDRRTFCPEVLYVYHYAGSHGQTASPEGQAEERRLANVIRSFPPYKRLESL